MKEMISFELGKETEKDVCSYNSNTFLAER